MKTLLTLGIVALLASFFFKVMHWPGANILAILGFILATTGTIVPLFLQRAGITAAMAMRRMMAVLLYGAGLMHMLTIPGGTSVFYSMVVLTIVYLLHGHARSELARSSGLSA